MKKVVGSLIICIMLMTTIAFAAYPADLEDAELQALNEVTSSENIGFEAVPVVDPEAYEENQSYLPDDWYNMDNKVEETGKIVDGNSYLMANDISLSNTSIYGNLYILGNNITISNIEVSNSVYIAGNNVEFEGTANDMYVIGNDVRLGANAVIMRDIKVGGSKITFDGRVGRNAYVAAEDFELGSTAQIARMLEYTAEEEITIPEGAEVGDVKFEKQEVKVDTEIKETKPSIKSYLMKAIKVAIKTVITACILVFLVGKFKKMERNSGYGALFGKGILGLVLVPILSVVLCITILGAGFGVSMMAIYIILLCYARAVMATEIAYRYWNKKSQEPIGNGKLIGTATGIGLVVWLVGLIPVIGIILKMVLGLMGLGVILTLVLPQKNSKVEE